MELKQYDDVILKDGQEGVIVELFETGCIVDVGNSPETWETIWVENEEIKEVRQKKISGFKQFYWKNVYIMDIHGKEWIGKVDTYFYPEENDSGQESILLKTETMSVEFEWNDIQEIRIVDKD